LVTIAVDTSAVIAVLEREPDADALAAVMSGASCCMSAGSLIEALRVIAMRRARGATAEVWILIEALRIDVVPVDLAQARLADEGQARFGKGRGEPPAVLNFGDLFAYALARHRDLPLLFKGGDFRQTDVRPALPARGAPEAG
jgi:ribonuclease VapC